MENTGQRRVRYDTHEYTRTDVRDRAVLGRMYSGVLGAVLTKCSRQEFLTRSSNVETLANAASYRIKRYAGGTALKKQKHFMQALVKRMSRS